MTFKPRKPHIPKFDQTVAGQMSRDAQRISVREIGKFAEVEKDRFKKRLEQQRFQSFKATPLADSTIAKKRSLGLSLKVMVATGWYVARIMVHSMAVKGGRLFYIGHGREEFAKDQKTGQLRHDVTLNRVALIQEKGAVRAGIPPRPHWAPGLADLRKRSPAARKKLLHMVIAAWKRKLGRKV